VRDRQVVSRPGAEHARTGALVPALLALAVVAGCADLPAIPAAVCGNGVVDPGEDCDGVSDPALGPGTHCGALSAGARACHYLCTPPVQRGCPAGWGCAADGVCRYAAGLAALKAAPGAPWPLPSRTFTVGDADGDGRLDVLAYGGTTFTARFGTGDGRFNAQASFSTGFGSGLPALVDLGAGGPASRPLDALLPQASGLYGLRVVGDRSFAPVAYPALVQPAGAQVERIVPLRLHAGEAGDALLHFVGATVRRFDEDNLVDGPLLFQLPEGRDGGALPGRVAVGDLDDPVSAPPTRQVLALALAGEVSVPIYAAATTSDDLVLRQRLALPDPVDAGARFVDVDGDGRLDLIVSLTGVDGPYVATARGLGDGTLGPAARDERFAGLVSAGCGTSPWPLAAGDLDHDGVADYVGARGVCVTRGLALVKTGDQPADRVAPWTEAVLADVNHDGAADVAALAAGEVGIDLLTGDPAGRGLFNYARVPTAAAPRFLRAGDFDGDYVADLAFVEAAPRVLGGDQVAVSFGASDGRPAAPVPMGDFASVTALEPAALVFGGAPRDLTSDLVVAAVDAGDGVGGARRSLTFLIGDAQRVMSATTPLRAGRDHFDTPGALAFADFDGDGLVDALVLASAAEGGTAVWVLHGDPHGRWRDARRELLGVNLPLACARLRGATLTPGAVPHVVGFTAASCDGRAGSPAATWVDLTLDAGGVPTLELLPVPDPLRVPTAFQLTDVDGDGLPDVLAAFAGEWAAAGGGAVTGAGVAIFWNRDGRVDPGAADRFLLGGLPAGVAPFAVAEANLDRDPEVELAIVTSGGLYAAKRTAGATFEVQGSPLTSAAVATPASALVAADLDGDGLDDLIFDGDDALHVFLGSGVNAADTTGAATP
jgi:hypothetical protein